MRENRGGAPDHAFEFGPFTAKATHVVLSAAVSALSLPFYLSPTTCWDGQGNDDGFGLGHVRTKIKLIGVEDSLRLRLHGSCPAESYGKRFSI